MEGGVQRTLSPAERIRHDRLIRTSSDASLLRTSTDLLRTSSDGAILDVVLLTDTHGQREISVNPNDKIETAVRAELGLRSNAPINLSLGQYSLVGSNTFAQEEIQACAKITVLSDDPVETCIAAMLSLNPGVREDALRDGLELNPDGTVMHWVISARVPQGIHLHGREPVHLDSLRDFREMPVELGQLQVTGHLVFTGLRNLQTIPDGVCSALTLGGGASFSVHAEFPVCQRISESYSWPGTCLWTSHPLLLLKTFVTNMDLHTEWWRIWQTDSKRTGPAVGGGMWTRMTTIPHMRC